MAGMKLSRGQIDGLVSDLANNASLIAALSLALANTNANVVSVSNAITANTAVLAANLANTNANVSVVSNTVTFIDRGYENVANTPIQANGVLYLDLASSTAFDVVLNRNITSIVYLNPPPSGVRKSWTLALKAVGSAYTVSWSNAAHNGGTAPSLNTTNGKTNVFQQFTDNATVTVRNFKSGEV
jgi:hypothetical protein